MDEAEQHPWRNQLRLPGDDAIEQRAIRLRSLRRLRIVAGDCVVGQRAYAYCIATCRELLEGAHAQVARRNPRQHGSRQRRLAQHPLSGGHRGKCPRGGHAKRRHRLAHNVLTQYRPQRGSAVSPARERSPAGTLELEVVTHAVPPTTSPSRLARPSPS